jgi:hypothetical protein
MLTAAVSIVVTLTVTRKDHMIKYILTNSSIDFLFLFSQFFLFIIRCGSLCPYGYTYKSKLYENYVYLYIGYDLITVQAIFNFFMTLERLVLFSSSTKYAKLFGKLNMRWLLFSFLIVALLINMPPYLIDNRIQAFGVVKSNLTTNETEILYLISHNKKNYQPSAHIFIAILILTKSPIFMALTGLVNILVAVKFNQFIQKKKIMLKITTKITKGKCHHLILSWFEKYKQF